MVPFLGIGMTVKCCTAGQGALEEMLESTSQLRSTLLQGLPADVDWPQSCVDFCPFKGPHHLCCVHGMGMVIRSR